MATPQELIAADDARKAREKAVVVAKATAARGPANDNDVRRVEERPLADDRPPDGHIIIDGVPMSIWLPPCRSALGDAPLPFVGTNETNEDPVDNADVLFGGQEIFEPRRVPAR